MKGYENWEKHHLLFLFHDIGCFFWGGGTSDRDLRYTRWKDAVKRTLGWESVTEEDDEVNPGNSPAWVSLQPFSPIPTRDTHPTRCKPWWKVQRTTRLLIPSCPPPPPPNFPISCSARLLFVVWFARCFVHRILVVISVGCWIGCAFFYPCPYNPWNATSVRFWVRFVCSSCPSFRSARELIRIRFRSPTTFLLTVKTIYESLNVGSTGSNLV